MIIREAETLPILYDAEQDSVQTQQRSDLQLHCEEKIS